MTAPVNGTDERLDVLIALLREVLAEMRQTRERQLQMQQAEVTAWQAKTAKRK
jgi:hypothetical protein